MSQEARTLRMRAGDFVRRHFQSLATAVQVFVDLAVVLLACLFAFQVGAQLGGPGAEVPLDVYLPLWGLIGVVALICFHGFGMYRTVKSLLNIEEFEAIAKSTVVCFLSVATALVFLRSAGPRGTQLEPEHLPEGADLLDQLRVALDFGFDPAAYSRATIGVTFVCLFLFTAVSRFVSFKSIQSLYRRGIGNRNAIVIGTGDTARWLTRKFVLVPTLGLRLRGFVATDTADVGRTIEGVPVLGTLADLRALVAAHKVTEAFVALPQAEGDDVLHIVDELEELGVTYRVVPRFYQLLSQKVRIEMLDSIPLISRAERRLGLVSRAAKRALDVLLALVGLIVSAPVFLVAAVLIKRDTPGPVFYRQVRIGKDGKPFRMYKFRTMYVHMSGDAITPSDEHDPRITPVGRVLRRYSLDEIPQIVNVLKGEMSMVGPRPEMPFIVATYGPLERERLRAKPGITGLWQISYARKEAIHQNLDYDIYYVENRSLLLDLVIIFLTFFAIVKGTGAH